MTEMLTGTACSDVTGRLYERIYQIAADGKNAAIVVPDQFVFETEKALFRKCSEHYSEAVGRYRDKIHS